MDGERVDLGIVGAGVAGLAAAHRLRECRPGLNVIVFEESGELGGRAATRQAHGAIFDDGAQYLKTPTGELQHFVAEVLPHDELRDIGPPVWVFDGNSRISPGDQEQNADPKWTYIDGIARLAAELAYGLDVRREVRIERLAMDQNRFTLFDARGAAVAEAQAVLLTPPAPRTAELIGRSDLPPLRRASLLNELSRASYRPCLSITLGYTRPPRAQPFYALVNTDRQHPISWLALEHTKPHRAMGGQGVLIAQMAPQWSRQHWDDDPAVLAKLAAGLVSELLREDLQQPAWSDCRAWPYALPDSGCDSRSLHNGDGLFFAGDYLKGQGRIHLALQSGWEAAEAIDEFFKATGPRNP
jgi:hypothetical protein